MGIIWKTKIQSLNTWGFHLQKFSITHTIIIILLKPENTYKYHEFIKRSILHWLLLKFFIHWNHLTISFQTVLQ